MWMHRKHPRAFLGFALTATHKSNFREQKTNKKSTMKNYLKYTWMLAITAVLLIGPESRSSADLSIVGITETIGNVVFGETTVAPSYCLYTWDYSYNWQLPNFAAYSGHYSKLRQRVRYDIVTGLYFFSSFTDFDGMGSTSNNSPFIIPSVALQNYSCYLTNNVTTIVQSYTVVETCSVTSTGLAPPAGPFNICLKTVGTALPSSCFSTNIGWTREFRKAEQVMPYGYVTTRLGVPNFSLAYPFQCWAGSVYQY
jgi:hypothetical protein